MDKGVQAKVGTVHYSVDHVLNAVKIRVDSFGDLAKEARFEQTIPVHVRTEKLTVPLKDEVTLTFTTNQRSKATDPLERGTYDLSKLTSSSKKHLEEVDPDKQLSRMVESLTSSLYTVIMTKFHVLQAAFEPVRPLVGLKET